MPLVPPSAKLTDDEAALVEAASLYAREELLPLDRQWDRDESSMAETLPRLSEMGLLSLCIPEEFAGLGCRSVVYAAILHEIATWSPSAAVTVAVHSMACRILKQHLQEPLRHRLEDLGRPEHFAAFALSEAGAGSDSRAIKTTAVECDGGFRVNGEKMWITNGLSARWFITLVCLKAGTSDECLSALLIDGRQPGLERSKITGKMGIRGSETAVLHFSNVFVPVEHLLGGINDGLRVFLSSLSEGRIGIAVQASGIAEACLSEMVGYARHREQFGKPIGMFQAVGNMIADSVVELETAKSLILDAAARVDALALSRSASSKAKLYASEAANRIAYRAVQVHGGAGYVAECRVEQLYRDARVTTIYEGTSEIQRKVIAGDLRKQMAGTTHP